MTVPNDNNHDDNQNQKGEQSAGDRDNGSLEEILDQELEELDEGDEPSGEGDVEGEQPDEAAAEDAEPPKRKWAGEFDSPEQMEEAFLRSTRKPADEKPKADPQVPDLNEQEVATLAEQDSSDNTAYLEAYLRDKMSKRNLEKHELAALRKIDNEKGTDLLGDYHEARVERRVATQTRPLSERAMAENRERFMARERSIDETNATEFGDGLQDLEKFCSSVQNVEKVLAQSPMGMLIQQVHQTSPATAHKMLLREANLLRQSEQKKSVETKRKRSVQADPGTGSGVQGKAKDRASSIDEAWDIAESENQ